MGSISRLEALCLVLALASSLSLVAHAYDSDKVYRYNFEASIMTKVADDQRPQFSGVMLSSPMLIKRQSSDELLVQLERPQMATFNQLIDDQHPLRPQYKPMENAMGLDKAFGVYHEDSLVKSFDTYKDEPRWVTNFKRGLLSFFQLKLESSETRDSSPAYYTTNERSVFGDCETDYLVVQSTDQLEGKDTQFLNVTKSRNMAKCKSKFLYRFMPIDSKECTDSDRDLQQYKHSNSIMQFQLTGSRKDPTIQEANLEEISSFSPFGQKAHSHQMSTRSKLRLDSILSSSPAGFKVEDGAQRTDSLAYDPPETLNFYANVNLEDEHHLSSVYQTRASLEEVMSAFDELVAEHRAYTESFDQSTGGQESSHMAQLFMRLNELVGTMDSKKLNQLSNELDERGKEHKKIFWDLMSVVGTNPSFMIMKKLITEYDPPEIKIKDFLTRVSYHIKMPSKSLFDEYVSLCKSDKIQSKTDYRRLCLLPLASLIHQHCVKPHAKFLRAQQEGGNATMHLGPKTSCQLATGEEYFAKLVTPLSLNGQSPDLEAMPVGERMLNVKMAGELGVKPSIDYLMDVVRNRDEHPSLRAAAMWNLNKVARSYPAQIKRLVVPYFFDQREQLEVRLAAFQNWFYSGIALHELETLAKQLSQEPSRQLVLYVNSMVSSVSELSPIPCVQSQVRDAKLVLPAIKEAVRRHSPASFSDSHTKISSNWLPEFGYGTASMMSIIYSNESMAPANIFYQSSEIMSGLKLSPMSVSIQAHGLDKLIKRVVGINGILADKESFMDIFSLKRRSKRQAAMADLIKQEANEIDKELKMTTREFSDVYIAVTLWVYGRPVTFIDRDSRELKKLLSEDGTVKIPQIKKLIHSFNNHTTQQMMINFEKFEVFNNELGLPLYQSISDFDYKTFKLNSISINVEPGFFKDERQGKPPTKFSAALDAKLGRHNEMLVQSGALLVNSRQQVGVGFHKKKLLNVPLKMSLEANLLENKITIKRQPIHDSILYIKQQPMTFVRGFGPEIKPRAAILGSVDGLSSSNSSTVNWRPLYDLSDSNVMKPFKLEMMTPLAVGVKLEGRHRTGEDWSMAAWRRHIASIGMPAAKFMYFYSPNGAPLEIRLSTVTTSDNPTKDLVSTLSWNHQHSEDYADLGQSPDPGAELKDIYKELEAFTNQGVGKPTNVNYKLVLTGGSSKERKAGLQISYSRSQDKSLHKWRVFYQRTPLDQNSPASEVTNLCWLGQLNFPKIAIDRYLKFDLLSEPQVAHLSSDLTFGDECSSAKVDAAPARLSIGANFDWTKEQRAMIEMAIKGETSDPASQELLSVKKNSFARMYQKCLKNREASGNQLDGVCMHTLRKASELLHVTANMTYKDVPERWTRMASRVGSLYTYARAGYIDEIDDRQTYGRNYKAADGKSDMAYLEANLTSCSMDRKLNYQFDGPNYHVVYKNLPFSLPPVTTFPLMGSSYYQMVQSRAANRMCSVSGNQVTTFDNLTYTMPQIDDGCFKVIAKDCSPESNFLVLGAKVGSGKMVKIYVANKFKVEFAPDKASGGRISDLKINGETVTVEANKLPLSRGTKLGQRAVEAFQIENNGAYYTLSSKLYKFSVSTDGTWIMVQQSKYYDGKSCGICGDANGDQLHEFKSPISSKKVCRNSNDFVWSYVVPSTCNNRPTTIECA